MVSLFRIYDKNKNKNTVQAIEGLVFVLVKKKLFMFFLQIRVLACAHWWGILKDVN